MIRFDSKKDYELYSFKMEENVKLQQENKILKENAENNDKVVDKVNFENMILKKENKELKECYCNRTDCSGRIKNSRKYDSLYQKYNKQLDNWNKLKEWIKVKDNRGFEKIYLEDIVYEIEELEQGRDSNE